MTYGKRTQDHGGRISYCTIWASWEGFQSQGRLRLFLYCQLELWKAYLVELKKLLGKIRKSRLSGILCSTVVEMKLCKEFIYSKDF